MQLNATDIAALDKRRRAAFVNSLTGYKPANLVGTASRDGQCNLAIMSSAVHLGSDPALLALVIRPGGEERHTLANILATGVYTLNHVTAPIVEAAHQTAARYPAEVSEFEATGLTAKWQEGFAAPLVAEAGVRIAMQLREHQELAINRTHLVIGEIAFVELEEHWMAPEGQLDLVAAGSVALAGLDSYYAGQPLKRMAYAKPDREPRILEGAGAKPDTSSTMQPAGAGLTQTGDAPSRRAQKTATS